MSQQEVCARVAARQRICVAGEAAVRGKSAARELVPDLQELVVPQLAAEPQRVLAANPGEVVHHLVHLVVDGERSVGVVAEAAESAARQVDVGMPQEFGSVNLDRRPDLLVDVLHARQFLADVVE